MSPPPPRTPFFIADPSRPLAPGVTFPMTPAPLGLLGLPPADSPRAFGTCLTNRLPLSFASRALASAGGGGGAPPPSTRPTPTPDATMRSARTPFAHAARVSFPASAGLSDSTPRASGPRPGSLARRASGTPWGPTPSRRLGTGITVVVGARAAPPPSAADDRVCRCAREDARCPRCDLPFKRAPLFATPAEDDSADAVADARGARAEESPPTRDTEKVAMATLSKLRLQWPDEDEFDAATSDGGATPTGGGGKKRARSTPAKKLPPAKKPAFAAAAAAAAVAVAVAVAATATSTDARPDVDNMAYRDLKNLYAVVFQRPTTSNNKGWLQSALRKRFAEDDAKAGAAKPAAKPANVPDDAATSPAWRTASYVFPSEMRERGKKPPRKARRIAAA